MSKEVRYNYNPNEGNEEYYKRVEEVARQIQEGNDGEDIDFYIIPEVLKRMGYEILVSLCSRYDYSGEIYVVYKDESGHYYLFRSDYGSCSVCDVWYDMSCSDGEEQAKEFARLFEQEDRDTVKFDSLKDVMTYVKEKQPYLFSRDAEIELNKLLNGEK